MNPTVIAPADPIALPAPVGVLYFLLLFTFVLHVVPMSFTLGGGLWALIAMRKSAKSEPMRALAHKLARWLPVSTAAAITSGVAPLLFLQVLYGQVFYSASVLMAWPWLSVVGLLVAGYYGYYFRYYQLDRRPGASFAVGSIAWLAFAAIAFIYVNQMTLMLHPERHWQMYQANRAGTWLHLAEGTLLPRYLHMLMGAVALSGAWVAALGALAVGRGEDEHGRAWVRLGARGYAHSLSGQLLIGSWLLWSQPGQQWKLALGGDLLATGALLASLLLAAAGAGLLFNAHAAPRPGRRVALGAGLAGGAVVGMVLLRDAVRRATLAGAVDFSRMQVSPQWPVIATFALLLVAGLATVGWMLWQVRRAQRAQAPQTAAGTPT